MMNGPISRRSTKRSRSINPRNARVYVPRRPAAFELSIATATVPSLLAKIAPRQPDEYRLERRLGGRDIAQAIPACRGGHLRQQSVTVLCKDAQPMLCRLDAGDASQFSQLLCKLVAIRHLHK